MPEWAGGGGADGAHPRDPRRAMSMVGGALLRMARMASDDYDLLAEVVKYARTGSGEVVIPSDLFRRIQDRVRDVETERRERGRLPEDDET